MSKASLLIPSQLSSSASKTRAVLLQAGTATKILLLVRSGHATDTERLKASYSAEKSAKFFYLVRLKSDERNEM